MSKAVKPIPVEEHDAAQPDAVAAEPARQLELDGLCALVGLHLRMTHAVANRLFTELLAPLDLTQSSVAVLWLINANPGVSQIDLATTLQMDRATMMAIVDRLDGRDLLNRQRSTTDRRRQELELTPAGRDLLARAQSLIGMHEADLKARIGADKLESFIATLRRLRE
jgi:DNA-binding MarR family transcriptional regulator